jgi:hypothetical protein
VKGQQLFHCFLPGVTAAVLTTQPAWANVIQVSQLQLTSSPSVLISTNSRNSFPDNSLQPKSNIKSNPGLLPVNYLSQGSIQPIGNHSLPVVVADNYLSIDGEKISKQDHSRFVGFSDLSNNNFLAVSNSQSSNLSNSDQQGDVEVAKLLKSGNCPQSQPKSQAALLLTSNTCLPQNCSYYFRNQYTSGGECKAYTSHSGECTIYT